MLISENQKKIAIIGIGYVGLPLAVEFGKNRPVLGFDLNSKRIAQLQAGLDTTLEISGAELAQASYLSFTDKLADLSACQIYIVTVPTPINMHKQPDLAPLISATNSVGQILKSGDLVIFESTVYPGCTEEICVPALEASSKLKLNTDFFVGYSPERINPGDKLHRLPNIKKVTSGSTPQAAQAVDALYRQIIKAGTYLAESIVIAEAAKVIENTQRDLNIALINELAIIFNRMNLDTEAVLRAAGTKWNFLPFRPGLVGGHCIGVDPYYLTHKAQAIGYEPEVILAGRRLNDGMSSYVASQLIKALVKNGVTVKGARILVMGLTFKENCPDTRNSRVVDVINDLKEFGCEVDVVDPWVDTREVENEHGIVLLNQAELHLSKYDGIILAVAHQIFLEWGIEKIRAYGKLDHILYDLKHLFLASESDMRL